jgi:hypothetical protein
MSLLGKAVKWGVIAAGAAMVVDAVKKTGRNPTFKKNVATVRNYGEKLAGPRPTIKKPARHTFGFKDPWTPASKKEKPTTHKYNW